MSRESRRHAAFTLVELMVVIVIIGLLAGAATIVARSYLIPSKQNVAKLEIANIAQALESFYAAHDRYPTNEEGLDALTKPSDKLVSGLLSKIPNDPWGHAYQYNEPGKNGPYDVVSFGADGREGGSGADQDIVSSELGDDRK
jgi:general secretion pathway protein G